MRQGSTVDVVEVVHGESVVPHANLLFSPGNLKTVDYVLPQRKLTHKQNPVHPTTGILAVFVALNYCDVVHVAGFGYPSSKSQRQPIHYYGFNTMRSMKNSYHDLSQEAEALKRLEDSGAILYLHPHS